MAFTFSKSMLFELEGVVLPSFRSKDVVGLLLTFVPYDFTPQCLEMMVAIVCWAFPIHRTRDGDSIH